MLQQTDSYLARQIYILICILILLEVTQKIFLGDISLESYLETEPSLEKS